jgi:UPF0716 protein FxsA
MAPILALLFIVVPFLELYLLIQIGQTIGSLPTIGLVVLMGIVGAALAKSQGLAALRRIHEEMGQGRIPTTAILDGVLIIAASILLITPGVLTDVVGVLLLLPPTRAVARVALVRWAQKHVRVVAHPGFDGGPQPWSGPRGGVIDVEATVRDVPPREGEPAPRLGTDGY